MKLTSLFTAVLAAAVLPLAASAQDRELRSSATTSDYGPRAGELEFTLGGAGGTNTDFNSSFGGVNFSVGTYLNDTLMLGVRQSVNYLNPDGGGTSWSGTTRVALDQHLLASGPVRPFVGISAGRIYGDAVTDTWAAGLEGGLKFYVQPKTFIFASAEYLWLFEDSNDVDDTFDDGQILWGLGVGFNF